MEELEERIHNCIAMLGSQVRAFRKAKKWTQAQLAERANLSSVFIGRLERANDAVSLPNLISIAVALEVPVISLMEPWIRENLSPRSSIIKEIENVLAQFDEKDLNWILELVTFVASRKKKEIED